MDFMSAFCVLVAQLAALHFGGTLTNLSVLQDYYRHTDSSLTAGTTIPRKDWIT